MGNSLQDQLLKAGLATDKQAKKAKAGKAPPRRGKKGQPPALSESAAAARQAQADKAARDKTLNERRKAEAELRERRAQIGQLIAQHRLSCDGGDIGYHFVDRGKVRKLYVTPEIQSRLGKGQLDIARLDGRYDVVPADVADRIRARDERCVVPRAASPDEPAEDDPYKDFKVPDDLMW